MQVDLGEVCLVSGVATQVPHSVPLTPFFTLDDVRTRDRQCAAFPTCDANPRWPLHLTLAPHVDAQVPPYPNRVSSFLSPASYLPYPCARPRYSNPTPVYMWLHPELLYIEP